MSTVADFTSAKILFDESHEANGSALWAPGNASIFSWMLGVNGYNSSTNFDQALDSGILNNYDILVLFFPMKDLTQNEIDAVHTFVNNGGGLLIVGVDTGNGWKFTSDRLNPIAQTYGISFNSEQLRGSTTDLATHNITHGVSSLMVDADQLWSCSLTLTGSAEPIATLDSKPIVASAKSGSGRVVAVATPAPFLMYRKGASGHGQDHFQFSLNVIDWLAGNNPRTANVPEIATIIVGDGPAVNASEYQTFVGLYHDHTTHSDGHNTVEEMVEAGLNKGLDFMVLTDHSYNKPAPIGGMTGGLAARKLVEKYGIDIKQIPGAELSSVKHTTGFPLKSNIFTLDQQEAIDGIHAQGAFATFCHPTIDPSYAPVYEAFDTYGFDAIEVDNMGFFYGAGEDGLYRRYLGASDGHSALYVGQMLNAVFVRNPTGPNGRINDSDIVDAALNKRVVILDRDNNLIYGQRVWVDRFLNLTAEAKQALADANAKIEALVSNGAKIGLSQMYLNDAQIALDSWNPARALKLICNATAQLTLGIDLSVDIPTVADPNESIPFDITVGNNHSYPISVNTSVYAISSLTIDKANLVISVPAEGTSTGSRDASVDSEGFVSYWLNIQSFNTTAYLMPVLLKRRAAIDNVTWSIKERSSGYSATIMWMIDSASRRQIYNGWIYYDDGNGVTKTKMEKNFNWYEFTLGPYTEPTNVTFHIEMTDIAGNTFTLSERTITVGPVDTTSPTGIAIPLDTTTIVLLTAGIGIVVVVIVGIVIKKRE
ncbi:MAG: hypothetical protein K9W43_02550 [Candidatus Thorarchaeota archaeon]|nr:hypothetical protein [Candidatus Thorarchaeota archaeon]